MINITATSFSVSEAQSVIKPLFLFVIAMVVYAIFVFKFYKFLSRKDVFKLNLQRYSKSFIGFLETIFSVIFYIIEFLIIFPLFTFFWFVVMSVILMLISKQDIGTILLISIALVSAIRVTAFYNEDLSQDLAKMLPFALLGVFLINISFFSFQDSLKMIKLLPSMWKVMVYYLGFAVALECVLRISHTIIYAIALFFVARKEE